MSTLEVVVPEVVGEVSPEGGVARHQRPGEGRSPALLEDGPLDPLDGTVGLRPAGADEALFDAEALDRLLEVEGAELGAVVGCNCLQSPAGGRKFLGDPADEGGGELGAGVARGAVDLGPDEGTGDIDGCDAPMTVKPVFGARPRTPPARRNAGRQRL